jgi:hypothetical protein
VELRWPLPLVFDAHAQRALKTLSRFDHLLGDLASDNSLLGGVPHLELTAGYVGGGDDFEISLRHKVPDFELALADDRQGWRLDPANSYDAPRTLTKNDGRGSGQRQVVAEMLERTLAYELRARSVLEFRPDGLRWVLRLPLAESGPAI